MSTIDYYNEFAKQYFESTINADMKIQYDMFLKYVKDGGKILDLGCGSGRDTLFFKNQGYEVYAIDGSKELCKLASEYTGVDVKCMDFMELNDIDFYDGIWASASLLHVDKSNLLEVLKKVRNALKEDGYLYIALKNGQGEEITKEGRYYNYLLNEEFESLSQESGLSVVEFSSSKSVSNPNETKYWNNYVLKRK